MKQALTRWLLVAASFLLHGPAAQAQAHVKPTAGIKPSSFSRLPQPLRPTGAPALRHALPPASQAAGMGPTRRPVRLSNPSAGARTLAEGPVSEKWVACFDNSQGNGYHGATDVAADAAGNVYVTGYSFSPTSGYDYATIKYSPTGQQLWQARYNGPSGSDEVAVSVGVDGFGGVYVTGYSYGTSTSGYDYATLKYDGASGQQLWVNRYTSEAGGRTPSSQELATDLAVDAGGAVFVTGTAYEEEGSYHYVTVKYFPNGQFEWASRYRGPASTAIASRLALDRLSNVYVTGTSFTSTASAYATLKYAGSTGQQLWEAHYAGPVTGYNLVRALAVDADGNVAVTGTSESGTSYDYATVKYAPTGQQLWQARYNGAGNSYDEATGVALESGNVAVTGYAETGHGNWDYVTMKYAAASGQPLWQQTYDGPAGSYDEACDLVIDRMGSVVVTGRSYTAQGTSEMATIAYAGIAGQPLWQTRSPESSIGDVAASRLAVDVNGSVVVTGSAVGEGGRLEYATFKYSSIRGQLLWQARYRGPVSEDQVSDVAVDGAGNVVVTGTQTIKYAANRQRQWRAPGGGQVVVSAAGNVYVSGATIRKYTADGQLLWETPASVGSAGMGLDAAGNVYIAGTRASGGSNQYVTLKYEAATGQQLWEARFSGRSENAVVDMAVDAAGNVYVTGLYTNAQNNRDYATLKYSSEGEQLWMALFTGPLGFRDQEPTSIAVDANGNVYVTGSGITTTFPVADVDYMTVQYSPTGQQGWASYYSSGQGGGDRATDITVDANGNVVVTGLTATVKYSPGGRQLWEARNNATILTQAARVTTDALGNVYVTGNSLSTSSTNTDYATVKYAAASGQLLWSARYNGPDNGADRATALAVTAAGQVYVAGNSFSNSTGSDYAIIRYDQAPDASLSSLVAATRTEGAGAGRSAQQLAVYPNPMGPQATVSFRPDQNGEGQVQVYNQLGQQVVTLYQGTVRQGQAYTLPLTSPRLVPGVYQCRLTVNGQHEVVRLLVTW